MPIASIVAERETRESGTRRALLRFGRFFGFASLGVILAAALLLGMLYRTVLVGHVEHFAQENNVALAQAFANNLGGTEDIVPQLEATLPAMLADLPVLKVKVYDRNGTTLFSTDPSEIGKREEAEAPFLSALRGVPASDLHLAVGGEPAGRSYVETYVPMRGAGGEIVRVFELYYDVTDNIEQLERTRLMAVAGILVILLAAHGLLVAMVRPADRAIRRQLAENLRLAGAIKNAPIGIFVADAADPGHPVIFVNPAFSVETEIEEEKALGKNVSALLGAEALASPAAEKKPIRLSWRPAASGREKEIHIAPVFDEAGKPTYLVGFVLDVSERAAAERRNKLLASAIEQSGDMVEITDEKARLIYVNPAFERTTGYSSEEVLGRTPGSFLRPDHVDSKIYADIWRSISGGNPWRGWFPGKTKSGDTIDLAVTVSPVKDSEGRVAHYVAVKRDMTQTVKANQTLKKLSRAVEQSSSMVVITDTQGVIEYVNPRFTQITGYAPDEAIGQNPRFLKSGRTSDETYARLWRAIARGDSWQGEIVNKKKDGQYYWEYQTISPVKDEAGKVTHFVAVKEDISERKKAEAKIEHLALYDVLTELPNRAYFQRQLAQTLARAKRSGGRSALLFLDLDEFKDINDTLGHPAGDALLAAAAKRLAAAVREGDFVARIGGDEFAILAPALDAPEEAAILAERVIAAIDRPFTIDAGEVFVGASIGIALFPDDGDNGETLLRNADLALYRCKGEGTNLHHFYRADMDAEVLERKLLAQDLRSALERHEFELHYQPILDIFDGRTVALEALLRWRHRDRGEIGPAHFIPIAEATRLIVPIGDWVLEEACRQTVSWREAGVPTVPVAVNLSAVQFRHRDLAGLVADTLERTGLPAEMLHVEITESVAMENAAEVGEALERLRGLGVQVSLDDFGTGYSSLSRLRHLPIDRLKIDRSFLAEFGVEEAVAGTGATIVSAIVGIGKSLGMRIVVEGIEHTHQLERLREMGEAEAQGYLFSRPMPADRCGEFLKETRAAEALAGAG